MNQKHVIVLLGCLQLVPIAAPSTARAARPVSPPPMCSGDCAEDADAVPKPKKNGRRYQDDVTGIVYQVMNGVLRQIPDPTTFNNLYADADGILLIDDIDNYVIGDPIEVGAILVESTAGALYMLSDGKKYHVASPAAVLKYHLAPAKAQHLPDIVIRAIPDASYLLD